MSASAIRSTSSGESAPNSQGEQPAMLRTRLQFAYGFEDGDAGSFGADESTRDIEAILWKELIQVVAGDSPWDIGEPLPDEVGESVAQASQACVDLSAASSFGDNGGEFFLCRAANAHAGSVVEENIECFHIVDRLASHQGMYATGVVANHSAKRAAAVRGGVGYEGELVLLRFDTQRIEDDSWFHAAEYG